MDDITSAQTLGKREIVGSLGREFARLHVNSCVIIESTPVASLYEIPAPAALKASNPDSPSSASIGVSILRCAAAVEQTFGGVTANLWDDPFEWTLPEYLSTPQRVRDHLAEVEALRQRAFSSFADDACLRKSIVTPAGATQLIELLSETLLNAADYQHQALLALKILSGISPRGFII